MDISNTTLCVWKVLNPSAQNDADVQYRKVLGYCATRWLSLMPALERLLHLFEPLKTYFLGLKMCPTVLRDFFNNEFAEAWLYFVHCQAARFHAAILQLEGSTVTMIEAAVLIKDLRDSTQSMMDHQFLPLIVRSKLQAGAEQSFKERACSFYEIVKKYFEKWCDHFNLAAHFQWMLLKTFIPWDVVQTSIEHTSDFHNSLVIDEVALFEEISRVNLFLTDTRFCEWKEGKKSTVERWVEVLGHFIAHDIPHKEIIRLASFFLCLPGTNAAVERVFSSMTQIWTSSKTQMDIPCLRAILTVKHNISESCSQFHDLLLSDQKLLGMIRDSHKYQ